MEFQAISWNLHENYTQPQLLILPNADDVYDLHTHQHCSELSHSLPWLHDLCSSVMKVWAHTELRHQRNTGVHEPSISLWFHLPSQSSSADCVSIIPLYAFCKAWRESTEFWDGIKHRCHLTKSFIYLPHLITISLCFILRVLCVVPKTELLAICYRFDIFSPHSIFKSVLWIM